MSSLNLQGEEITFVFRMVLRGQTYLRIYRAFIVTVPLPLSERLRLEGW
jgi:hypothetical protein